MTTWEAIKEAISGAAAVFRFREKQGDRLNTPEMVKNAEAVRDQKIKDEANAAVAKGDLDEIRRKAG